MNASALSAATTNYIQPQQVEKNYATDDSARQASLDKIKSATSTTVGKIVDTDA
jgi:hypothetical protein